MKRELPTIRRIPDDLWAEISASPRRGEGAWHQREAARPLQGRAEWDTTRAQDGVPVEGPSEGVWVRVDVPQRFQQWVGEGVFERNNGQAP